MILFFILVPSEPIWSLDRRESSGQLFWRRDQSKVKFRCEVEVLEYEKDPIEDQICYENDTFRKTNLLVVCATCAAALAVTVVLPWFLMGSS